MELPKNFHSISIEAIASVFNTNIKNGLSTSEAEMCLKRFGKNKLVETKKAHPLFILFKQFLNAMTYLLLAAATLSFLFQEWLDGIAIIIVILINSSIAFWMEWQAEKSMTALKKMVAPNAKVVRNNEVIEILSEFVVPGDILLLEAGDMIAADARLFQNHQLQANESTLTGESLPVDKNCEILDEETILAERYNMVYKGTFVSKGNGKAVVVATGMETELGQIARMVQSSKQVSTPLEKKLNVLSKKLIAITIALVIFIFIIGIINEVFWLDMLKTAIALAVAAIPEGLPIVATLALAQGMMKMAKRNVIVKRLSAVETLGGTNIICSDKTGTLTQNRIEVSVLDFPSAWAEVKNIKINQPIETEQKSEGIENENLNRLLEIAVLCNTAEYSIDGQIEKMIGDPLETGLLRFANNSGINITQLRNKFVNVDELPFDSATRLMAVKHVKGDNYFVSAKGAIEELINHCTYESTMEEKGLLSDENKQKWLERASLLAQKGLRVLAFAYKETERDEELLGNLVFAGIIGFVDPPAEGVQQAILECKQAGIDVVMITGDHPATALTIAKELGLTDALDNHVMNGKDMASYDSLSDEERKKWLHTKVFARVSPAQKLDLVTVFQEQGKIVGMTGDGVNDAPALKKSDIGIAMGIRGTQVAQEAADMVLKDDSFISIIEAIKQGRIIFDNIRKFVVYLLSSNLSELMIVTSIALINLPLQLFPLQILFINLISDVLPALALGVGKGSKLIMKQKPKHADEPILTDKQWKSIWVYAIVISLFSLGAVLFSHFVIYKMQSINWEVYNNIVFLSLISSQLLHVFNMSSAKIAFHKNEVFTNQFIWYALVLSAGILVFAFQFQSMREVLHLHHLSELDWVVILTAGFGSLLVNRLIKKLKLVA